MNGMALALVLACIAYCSRSVEAQCKVGDKRPTTPTLLLISPLHLFPI